MSVRVLADEEAVSRIAQNLVENAIKYTPSGGRVTVKTRKEPGVGILEIEDTGIGIDPNAIPRILEAFEQESEGLDRAFEGSGLGLPIARSLAETMNGSVNLDTKKGAGSRFTVSLPAVPADE